VPHMCQILRLGRVSTGGSKSALCSIIWENAKIKRSKQTYSFRFWIDINAPHRNLTSTLPMCHISIDLDLLMPTLRAAKVRLIVFSAKMPAL
jgi:hypothetical protein